MSNYPNKKFVATGLLLAGLLGGCAGGKMVKLNDADDFRHLIATSDKPVLVDFYKGGCPTCAALDGKMDQLADEYRGKAVIAKFMLMTPIFTVTAPDLKKQYDVHFYPTVILFSNGSEWKGAAPYRFVMDYEIGEYRVALNEAIRQPGGQQAVQPPPSTTRPAGSP